MGRKRFYYAKSDYFDYFGFLVISNNTQLQLSFAFNLIKIGPSIIELWSFKSESV